MLYRTVPKTGDKLSTLGYGCMRFPTSFTGAIDEEKATAQLHRAIDQGLNYLDTAYPYHNRQSEPFLGRALANGYREKVKIATKLPHWISKTKEEMHDILQDQLNNLKTDHVDYYLIHALNGESWEKAKSKGVIEFLNEALEQKKIIHAGFSFHGKPEDFKKIVDDYPWTFCQIQYNILDTKNQAGTEGLKYAASKDLAVIVMEPLRGGVLCKEPPKEIRKIYDASGHTHSPTSWALKWLWNHPEVTVVLSGMNNDDHIDENIKSASETPPDSLSDIEVETLGKVGKKYKELMPIGCTGCNYCLPCPKNVNIPACFDAYNSHHMFKDKMAKLLYLGINGPAFDKKSSLASECVDCGVCLKKCPQGLPIPDHLKTVKKELEGWFSKFILWVFPRMMNKKRKK